MCVGEESLLWCGLEFCCGRRFGEISIPFCLKAGWVRVVYCLVCLLLVVDAAQLSWAADPEMHY